jgi:hypothetical protein
LNPGDGRWYGDIWLSCIGLAVALAVVGFAIVLRSALGLKARLAAYRDLPVVVLAGFTGNSVARIREAARAGAQLLPRTQRALIDLQEARDSLERSAATIGDGARTVGRFFFSRR